jgi:hypothetical protein
MVTPASSSKSIILFLQSLGLPVGKDSGKK